MDSLAEFVAYDELTVEPLAKLGWDVSFVSWRSADVCWDDFAAVVIRSPWDYHHDSDKFMSVLELIEQSSARLLNPLAIVRWNIDKHYLQELQNAGADIVPTHWVHSPTVVDFERAWSDFQCDELVVKPTIGAGARDTFRLRLSDPVQCQQICACYRGRSAMVQPFLPSILSTGEWSLFYFAGHYSHTILKTPKPGDFRVQEEYGSTLTATQPTGEQLQLAQAALKTIGTTLLYARVDLVQLPDNRPAIIELELIEPSLYFPYAKDSVTCFAAALDEMLR